LEGSRGNAKEVVRKKDKKVQKKVHKKFKKKFKKRSNKSCGILHNGGSTKKVRKKSSKKSSKKSLKKSLLKKFENITNCRREGGEGREGGELSFQCLRPSTKGHQLC
jgi:hypothetical protein